MIDLSTDPTVLELQAQKDHGGLALDHVGQAVIPRGAGYSLLGPLALNCAAPDEGNILLLDRVASPAQRERHLAPLARGGVRSCLAMTEPSPGARSDLSTLRTTALQDGDECAIEDRKWFITGADGAAFATCMAVTPSHDVPSRRRQPGHAHRTARGQPRHRVRRRPRRGRLRRVPGRRGRRARRGRARLRYAQVRLAPPGSPTACAGSAWPSVRTTWCSTGSGPEASGRPLAELGMAQQIVANGEIDIAPASGLILRAAWLLDQGERAWAESSVTKTFVAEAVNRVIDRTVQLHGALGVSDDVPLALFTREVRPFRIYDGASEVHRMSISQRAYAVVRRRAPPQPSEESTHDQALRRRLRPDGIRHRPGRRHRRV